MRRREFIAAIGGASTMPVVARAQTQRAAMPVVGMINAGSAEAAAYRVAAFRQGLNETGYVEGRNLAIEYHWVEGRYDLIPEIVADLIRRGVAVIATPGSTAAGLAVKAATNTIPIVFGVGTDPVKLGLVASLSRPGGNVTGVNFFTADLGAKRLGLLREVVPGATRVAVLVNPANAANADATLQSVQSASHAMGLSSHVLTASTRHEIGLAFSSLVAERFDCLLVSGDGFFASRRLQLAMLAVRHGVPAIYSLRDYPEVGGLMSYGPSLFEVHRQVGAYTGQILNGTKPTDLPVLQSTKFEFVFNTQAATLLGLDVSPTFLARTDVVIE
jgi:putative tryptophan/tyrosine transport system substrate-binding protein